MIDHSQSPLFVEDLNTALADVVRALGGFKKVGATLKPDKMADEAGRWLSDCMNRDKREKLDLDQIMWLLKEGRKIGCHTAIHFMATEAGYSSPTPIEPKDEMAELQRQFMESVRMQAKIADRIEKLHPQVRGA